MIASPSFPPLPAPVCGEAARPGKPVISNPTTFPITVEFLRFDFFCGAKADLTTAYCGQLWRSACAPCLGLLRGKWEMGRDGDPPTAPIDLGREVVRYNLIVCGQTGRGVIWRMPVGDRCAPQTALSAVG